MFAWQRVHVQPFSLSHYTGGSLHARFAGVPGGGLAPHLEEGIAVRSELPVACVLLSLCREPVLCQLCQPQ